MLRNFSIVPAEQTPNPKRVVKQFLKQLRFEIDSVLAEMDTTQALTVEGHPDLILYSLRKWYVSHGFPNTNVKKHKLYIKK